MPIDIDRTIRVPNEAERSAHRIDGLTRGLHAALRLVAGKSKCCSRSSVRNAALVSTQACDSLVERVG